ncbi:MAG: pseudouridine synthase [Eubacteriales bacterium]|nr:pseudouridine synthase [Eubacteriales bacterium]
MRLDRCLANAGFGSRTEVKELIRRGLVTVGGVIVRDAGLAVDAGETQAIHVGGESAMVRRHLHYMLHKPAGLLTALDDKRLPTIGDLLPTHLRQRGIFPIGRLDRDTTGLLILTTDGTLGHRLASPQWEVWKTYEVTIDGAPFDASDVTLFAAGLQLLDGLACRPAQLEPTSLYSADLTIHEGKFHQIKRMMLSTGRTVTKLHRRSVGGLMLDAQLAPGEFRELTTAEIAALYQLVELDNQP